MKVKRIGAHDLPAPAQATDGAAGYDLRTVEGVRLVPGERAVVKTGFAMDITKGMVGIIKPRSGLAVNHGIDILAGVIDSDFRGQVQAVLINHGHEVFTAKAGDRIAQLVVVNCLHSPYVVEVESLDDTVRGGGGFGSTGVE